MPLISSLHIYEIWMGFRNEVHNQSSCTFRKFNNLGKILNLFSRVLWAISERCSPFGSEKISASVNIKRFSCRNSSTCNEEKHILIISDHFGVFHTKIRVVEMLPLHQPSFGLMSHRHYNWNNLQELKTTVEFSIQKYGLLPYEVLLSYKVNWTWRVANHCFIPIASMGLVYSPTWMVDFYGKCSM